MVGAGGPRLRSGGKGSSHAHCRRHLLLLLLALTVAVASNAGSVGCTLLHTQPLLVSPTEAWGSFDDAAAAVDSAEHKLRRLQEGDDSSSPFEDGATTVLLTHRDAPGSLFRSPNWTAAGAVAARLERDSARVAGITLRVRSAVEGVRLPLAVSFADYEAAFLAAAAVAQGLVEEDLASAGNSTTTATTSPSPRRGGGHHRHPGRGRKHNKKSIKAPRPRPGPPTVDKPGDKSARGAPPSPTGGGDSTFQAEVVSGLASGSGEYFANIGVGSGATATAMVIDTGSDLLWLQCAPCTSCYTQQGPIFDPLASRSYARLPCAATQCRALDAHACATTASSACVYQVTYGDGSFSIGDLATDTLTFAGGRALQGLALGCGHDNQGLFVGAAGLLGLGRGALSLPSQALPPARRRFSYCLVDRASTAASTLSFGGTGGRSTTTLWTPLLSNPRVKTFYYVAMEGVTVGGARVAAAPASAFALDPATGTGGVIVDSGTSVTRLPRAVYAALRDAFVAAGARGELGRPAPGAGFSIFDTCYDLAARAGAVQVPVLGLLFRGGVEVRLPARNYLVQVDDAGTVCLALAPAPGPVSIIGNIQQMGFRVVHDVPGSRIGFTPAQC